jgi:hypothetical protein
MTWLWLVSAAVVGLGGIALLWRPVQRFGREVQAARAQELFRLQRERLEADFLRAAETAGVPRGVRWTDCAFEPRLVLVRDRNTGQLLGLAPFAVHFEPIAGEALEDAAAAGERRAASAVFFFERGQWRTVGKALFNMGPEQALDHFQGQYERVTSHGVV